MPKQRGFLILAAVWCIVITGIIAAGISYLAIGQFNVSNYILSEKRASTLAVSAVEKGLYQLKLGNCNANYSTIDTSLSTGEYRYKCEYYNLDDSLSGAINAITTTITLDSTAGFSALGEVTVDSESIAYNAIQGNNLIGVRRGFNGTTPASHNNNASVRQDNYVITGQGASPTFANPLGQTLYSQSVQLGGGGLSHAAGDKAIFYEYEGTSWSESQNVSNKDIYALDCTSATKCFAAGKNGRFYSYDGSSWAQSQTLNDDVYGLSCLSPSDCWAVGKKGRIYSYNGSSWSQFQKIGNQNIRGISCSSPTSCWAAGKKGEFYSYNGSTWSNTQSVGNKEVNAISCTSLTNCWAAGKDAIFYYYNGATWSQFYQNSNKDDVNAIDCIDSNNCFATGKKGRFYQYNGSSWSQTDKVGNDEVNALRCIDANSCWAAGKDTRFYYYDGSNWRLFQDDNDRDVNAIYVGSGSSSLIRLITRNNY